MPANMYARSLFVLTLLYGMVFAIGLALIVVAEYMGAIPPGLYFIPAIFAVLFIMLQFLISPYIMDFMLRWIYNLHWIDFRELPPHLREFILQMQGIHKFSIKKVGIIHDLNPNAFTYGHFRKNARIVLSEGIFEFLNEKEQRAVVAHEIGHIVHRDFFIMTLAGAIPMIAYTLYLGIRSTMFSREALKTRGRDADEGGAAVGAIFITVAIASFIVYILSQFMVLLLSRIREYYADRFAADNTGNPGDLSTALVKIAYGMVKAESMAQKDKSYQKGRNTSSWRSSFQKGVRAMGIFDVRAASAMSMNVSGRGQDITNESVSAAASWDLTNPWGRFLEIQSTHPLPAKRLLALDAISVSRGQQPLFPDIGKIKPPESLWDEFLIDLFLEYVVPFLLIVLPLIGAFAAPYYGFDPLFGAGLGLIVFAFFWWLRKREKYPHMTLEIANTRASTTIVDALKGQMEVKNSYYEVSPVRGKPIVLEGTIVGRGQAGYYFSEDLVLEDSSGIITIDYESLLGFMNWFFALSKVPKLMGQRVRIYGWFHRGAGGPYVKLWKLQAASGQEHTNRWSGLSTFIIMITFFAGLFLMAGGLLPFIST